MFIGRKAELKELESCYSSNKFELAVVYGRRRIGKTTLIQEFCKDKKTVFYVASQASDEENFHLLVKAYFETIFPEIPTPSFSGYDDFFRFISKHLQERLIIVIDEYPYLAESNPAISSILQKYIDMSWRNSKLMLILSGSSMSFMENQVLGHKSPLYGRRTLQFKLEPFELADIMEYGWNYSNEDLTVLYAITGGIAEYLSHIDPSLSLKENIINMYLKKNARMFEEPNNLLQQELRDPSSYNTVLEAIANGRSSMNDIALFAGIQSAKAVYYINNLLTLGIIKKEKPYGADISERKSVYSMADGAFTFWYRFVKPNISLITFGNGERVYNERVEPFIADYMGHIWEIICTRYLFTPAAIKRSKWLYGEAGRWWGTNPLTKKQIEVDIMSYDRKNILFGECKWTQRLMNMDDLKKLIDKTSFFKQENKCYYLFSKSGFDEELIDYSSVDQSVILVELADILK